MQQSTSEDDEALLNPRLVEVNSLSQPTSTGQLVPDAETSAIAGQNTYDVALLEGSGHKSQPTSEDDAQVLIDGDGEVEDEEDEVGEGDPQLEDEWDDDDSESAYEELLEGLTDEALRARTVSNACTYEEALELRTQLRSLGKERFVDEYLFSDKMTARKLLTAFGIMPPNLPIEVDDEVFYGLLNMGMERELHKRLKLRQYNTVDDAVALIQKSKNIIVVTGAGISTSLGIPDFRSAGTGFYDRLVANGLLDKISEPSEVFDLHIFNDDPSIFYSVARDVLPPEDSTGKPRYTPTHAFIKLLEDHGRLLRNYTQNIDNIESLVGISKEKIVQCHGSFATATCQKCRHQIPGEEIFPQIRKQEIAYCTQCSKIETGSSTTRKRKRTPTSSLSTNGNNNKKPRRNASSFSDSDEESDSSTSIPGVYKPDITFFGEDLPELFHTRILEDRPLVDLVIVIGTSLKVAPVANIPSVLDPNIPQIYISKSRCSHIDFDIEFNGECDAVTGELVRRLGWDLKHEMLNDQGEIRVERMEGEVFAHRWLVWNDKGETASQAPGSSETPLEDKRHEVGADEDVEATISEDDLQVKGEKDEVQ